MPFPNERVVVAPPSHPGVERKAAPRSSARRWRWPSDGLGPLSPAFRLFDEGEDVGDALVGIRCGNVIGVAAQNHQLGIGNERLVLPRLLDRLGLAAVGRLAHMPREEIDEREQILQYAVRLRGEVYSGESHPPCCQSASDAYAATILDCGRNQCCRSSGSTTSAAKMQP